MIARVHGSYIWYLTFPERSPVAQRTESWEDAHILDPPSPLSLPPPIVGILGLSKTKIWVKGQKEEMDPRLGVESEEALLPASPWEAR